MKTILSFLLLFSAFQAAEAQTLTYYHDASKKDYPCYSYTITAQIQRNGKNIAVKLLKVLPDSKGFYYEGKYYPAAQLGNECPPAQDWDEVALKISQDNGNAGYHMVDFKSIGEVEEFFENTTAHNFRIENAYVYFNSSPLSPCQSAVLKLNSQKSTASAAASNNSAATSSTNNSATTENNPAASPLPSVDEQLRNLGIDPDEDHVEKLTSYATSALSDLAEQARENRLQRERMQAFMEKHRKEREEKANLMLGQYLEAAKNGNEQAIEKAAEAYSLLEQPDVYYSKIQHDDFYGSAPEEYEIFLKRSVSQYNSPVAKKLLKSHSSAVAASFQTNIKTLRRKAITSSIMAVALGVGVGYYGSKAAIDNSMDGVSYATGIVGICGGLVYFVRGTVNGLRLGSVKNDSRYMEAQEQLRLLSARKSISFAPVSYAWANNNIGLSLKMEF